MKDGDDSIEDALDAALEMTFPASDPIALFMQEYDESSYAGVGDARIKTASAAMLGSKA